MTDSIINLSSPTCASIYPCLYFFPALPISFCQQEKNKRTIFCVRLYPKYYISQAYEKTSRKNSSRRINARANIYQRRGVEIQADGLKIRASFLLYNLIYVAAKRTVLYEINGN